MELQSDGVSVNPDAIAVERDGEWWVTFPEESSRCRLFQGLELTPDAQGTAVRRSRWSLPEAVVHLREGDALEPAEAADHYAKHFQRFATIDLCQHGLPIWHANRERIKTARGRSIAGSCVRAMVDGTQAVRVQDLQTMLTAWSRIENAPHALDHGHGLSPTAVEDLLKWPILPAQLRRQYAAAISGNRPLDTERAHHLVSATVTALMTATRLTPVLLWRTQQPPSMGLRGETTLGLYAFDLIERIGRATSEGTYTCRYCLLPYTPRRAPQAGELRVCSSPPCRKARNRAHVAAHRARNRPDEA